MNNPIQYFILNVTNANVTEGFCRL